MYPMRQIAKVHGNTAVRPPKLHEINIDISSLHKLT